MIESVSSYHVVLNSSPSYWEETDSHKITKTTERFELRDGWQTVYARKPECLLVKITLKNGYTGWGEANVPIGPEIVKLIISNILSPLVKKENFSSPNHMWKFLYDLQRGRGYHSGYYLDALAALDIAVWDAISKSHGIPLAKLFKKNPLTQIPIYLSGLRQRNIEEKISNLKKWTKNGLQGVKLFLPANNLEISKELSDLQSRIPEINHWMVDLLWMSDIKTAIEIKENLQNFQISFLECPLQPENLDEHKLLVSKPGVPIALGEHFRTHYQVSSWFKNNALNIFQPDIGRTGFSNALKQLKMSIKSNIQVTPHMGMGSPVFQAATLHFSSICENNYLQEYQAGLANNLDKLVKTSWKYDKGYLKMPQKPGLGVEIDEINILENSVNI
jgi:L-alanine-DL-glutamate epimerase-like enolase superfamily enzyme